jgi:hypothetical protein
MRADEQEPDTRPTVAGEETYDDEAHTQCQLRCARASTHGLCGFSLIRRTAVCGPACTVVWQGRRGDPFPYAD